MSIVTSLPSRIKIEPFLDRIITVMKNRLPMDYNIVHKRQWLDKDQSFLPGPKANIHGKKILLCVLWMGFIT